MLICLLHFCARIFIFDEKQLNFFLSRKKGFETLVYPANLTLNNKCNNMQENIDLFVNMNYLWDCARFEFILDINGFNNLLVN